MSDLINYSAVLADLETRRAALDAAIAAMRAVVAGSVGGSIRHNGEVPEGTFHGKSIREAITIYLRVQRKATSGEIAKALQQGGIESTSSNFKGIVQAVLSRSRKAGEVERSGKHWGLVKGRAHGG